MYYTRTNYVFGGVASSQRLALLSKDILTLAGLELLEVFECEWAFGREL